MHSLLEKARDFHNNRRNEEVLALLATATWEGCMPLEDEAMLRCYFGSAAWKLDQMLIAHKQFAVAYGLLPLVTNPEYACSIEICESFRLSEMGEHVASESMLAGAYLKYSMPDDLRAHLLRNWGGEARALGRRKHAVDLLSRSVSLYEQIRDGNGWVGASINLASCYADSDEYLAALRLLDSVRGSVPESTIHTQAQYWRTRALVLSGLTESDAATQAIGVALDIAARLNLASELAEVCMVAALVMKDRSPNLSRDFADQALRYGLSARSGAIVASAMGML